MPESLLGRALASRGLFRCAVVAAGLVAIVTALLVATSLAHAAREDEGATNLVAFYAAGTIVRQGDRAHLYDIDVQEAAERAVRPAGLERAYAFVFPAFSAWLFAPLTLLSYRQTQLAWAVANVAGLALLLLALSRYLRDLPPAPRRAFLFAAAVSTPAMATVLGSEVEVLIAGSLFASYLLLCDRRDGLAGVVAAGALFKPHLLAGVVLFLLVTRRWRALASLAAVAAPLLLLPALALGPHTIADHAHLLARFPAERRDLAVDADTMANWRGVVVSVTGSNNAWLWAPGLALITLAALTIAILRWRDGASSLEQAYALALLLPLVASPHVRTQSLLLAFVAGALALRAAFAAPEPLVADERDRRAAVATNLALATPVVLFACWYAGIAGVAPAGLVMLGVYALAAWRWPGRAGACAEEAPRRAVDVRERAA